MAPNVGISVAVDANEQRSGLARSLTGDRAPGTHPFMLYRVVWFVLVLLSTAGCQSSQQVKPSELPKLDYSFAAPVVASGGNLVAVRVAQVEKPDGTIAEVKGEFDVRLTLNNRKSFLFEHPVRVSLKGGLVEIAGGNRPKSAVRLEDIREVEVTQFDGTKTIVGLSVGSVGLTLLTVLLAFAII